MKTIDIIVPVYNEENTLDLITNKIKETDYCGLEKRIIYVDDCSTDKSREILANYKDCMVLYHEKNQGKGAAIATGLKASTADIIIIQDADLEYNPEDYQKLLPYIINGEEKVVYGSRLKDNSNRKSFLFLSFMANTFLTLLTNVLYRCKITDMETCFKAFSKEAIFGIDIKSKKFEFEVEITAKMIKKGYSIKEVPISYNGRTWESGKKICWKDAVHAIFALFYYKIFN
jgi:glycosyltransferase involved in cell wall biosynthesis